MVFMKTRYQWIFCLTGLLLMKLSLTVLAGMLLFCMALESYLLGKNTDREKNHLLETTFPSSLCHKV